jgi:ubiquinone/menaquinone biosynthesis C-methylase UbiE
MDISAIDWNEAWNDHGPTERGTEEVITCLDRWSDLERCKKFDRMAKKDNWKASWERIRAMDITPESRVLDIGSGPGTLAVPLSGMVRHVTAVEPSPGMAACLDENIRSSGIGNISVVRKKWEDVSLSDDLSPPYDVVVASYSLGVPDLRDALLKMDRASGKYVYIFWFADMQSPWRQNYREIWEDLYGVPCNGARKPNIIYNLLTQLGIYANVMVTKEERIARFASIDEAVADQSEGLRLKTDEQKSVLREFLTRKLEVEDGSHVLRATSRQARIWWEKED